MLASFPGPHPASHRLKATGSWARAWEQGYKDVTYHMNKWTMNVIKYSNWLCSEYSEGKDKFSIEWLLWSQTIQRMYKHGHCLQSTTWSLLLHKICPVSYSHRFPVSLIQESASVCLYSTLSVFRLLDVMWIILAQTYVVQTCYKSYFGSY